MENFTLRMMGDGSEEGERRRSNMSLIASVSSSDPMVQLSGLHTLCEKLTMSAFVSPSMMVTIPLLLPPLLRCLTSSEVRDISILAARALTYIFDILPQIFDAFPSRGLMTEALLHHLRSIEDVDLSEQCITCLELISRSAVACSELLRCGGVEAVLGFADFFTLTKQRQIWVIVQRLCGRVDPSTFCHIAPSLGSLRVGITSGDGEIRHAALSSMICLLEGCIGNSETVELVFGDTADRVATLLREADVKDETRSAALTLLLTGVRGSPNIVASVIESDLLTMLLSQLRPAPASPLLSEPDGNMTNSSIGNEDPPALSGGERIQTGSEVVVEAVTGVDPDAAPESSPRTSAWTSHQRTTVCQLLASLLVPYRSGVAEGLERLEKLTRRSLLTGALAVDDSASEEDDENVEAQEEGHDTDCVTTEDDEDGGVTAYPFREDVEAETSLSVLQQRIEEEPGLRIQTNPAFARCQSGNFTCDGCDKTCVLGDWYRCNDCRDKDFCAACLLEHYKNDNDGLHSYTDMAKLMGATFQVEGRRELYLKSPHLLQRVLAAVPTVTDVAVASDLVAVRIACLEFLTSAVDMASVEQLTSGPVANVAFGEVLNNNLRGTDLVCNALAVALAGRLLNKVNDTYRRQLVREGVKLSLQLLKQRCRVKGKSSSPRESATILTRSKNDWRVVIGSEASSLLHLFLGVDDEQAMEALRQVVLELRRDNFSTAVTQLHKVLSGDVTAFEFYSSGVVNELKNCLSRQNVFAVMQLIAALSIFPEATVVNSGADAEDTQVGSPGSPGSPAGKNGHGSGSPLLRFVHHLHTILTLVDEFTVPSYDYIGGVHKYFCVSFEPHRAAVAMHGGTTTASSSSASSSSSFRGILGADSENSTISRRSIKARIRPLSSVSAMTQALSPGDLETESDEDADVDEQDGGAVTNVLPNLHPRYPPASSAVYTGRTAREALRHLGSGASGQPSLHSHNIWIRYGTHVLPLSMTMLQIIEHLVLPDAAAAEAAKQNNQRRKKGNVPGVNAGQQGYHPSASHSEEEIEEDNVSRKPPHRVMPRDMANVPGYSTQNPVVLYYSSAPYNPQHYAFFQVPHSFPPSGDARAPLRVHLASQDSEPTALRELKKSLSDNFQYSRDVLTDRQRDVLALLGVMHAAVSNWSALLVYLQHLVEAKSEGLDHQLDVPLILNVFSPSITVSDFQHLKLNSKAVQHCSQLLLAGQQRGTWAVKLALDCSYLFTYTTRKFLFDVAFTSLDRCLINMHKYRDIFGLHDPSLTTDQRRRQYAQLPKKSKRVWREDVLACAKVIFMASHARCRNHTWSFQFYNEKGWGEGPTREFYTLVSQKLRERSLGLWRDGGASSEDTEYDNTLGLFPKPVTPGSAEQQRIIPLFHLMGRFIGRAIIDGHVPGLSLSPACLRLLRGDVCGVYDVKDISEELGRFLIALTNAGSAKSPLVQLAALPNRVQVQDLGLDFTLPGDDSIELRPGGVGTTVTAANVMEYCDAVTDFLLNRGVAEALQALREGFDWYIPLVALQMLSVDEIYQLIAGHETAITRDDFEKYSEASYGYTRNCKHVQWLFDILASFTVEEQKRFFLFLTGSAHLPVGGLGRLRPAFTIVRKTSDDAKVKEQELLPSAMTCQNYLKLPQYNDKMSMERKLRLAMTEGGGAFLLS